MNTDEQRIVILPLGGENIFHIEPSDIKKIHERSLVIIDSDLKKPLAEGGNIKQDKQTYKQKCEEADVDFIMLTTYRTLENMYPTSVLAKVLGICQSNLNSDPYGEITQINDKVKVGELVASEMTTEEATNFPLVSEIIKWWSSDVK